MKCRPSRTLLAPAATREESVDDGDVADPPVVTPVIWRRLRPADGRPPRKSTSACRGRKERSVSLR